MKMLTLLLLNACLLYTSEFGCPLVFAKKTKTKNIAGDVYTSKVESFTHGTTYDIIAPCCAKLLL